MMARKILLSTCLIGCAFLPMAGHADGPLPADPTIVQGEITITTPSDVQMLVQQSGQAGIIDWGSFSIDQGSSVDFQNGSGATLNRVTGSDLSTIMGSLTATGSVYIINQNGIIIGETGQVNTGGLFVASTLDLGNEDFLNGGDKVFAGNSPAAVINLGRISSLGGDVSLMARQVVNRGTISAPGGTVGLVAGREILMRDASVADGMFSVRIGGSDTSVRDSGSIAAAAAELRANGGNVYALAGNTQGTIAATGVAKVDGRVFLTAGDGGTVRVTKQVKATNADGSGGRIDVNGGSVDMAGTLDASGTTGGMVVINSTVETMFSGTALAFGADVPKSGGFVEVSGRHLTFEGTVETGGGTVLIDPDNIEIADIEASARLGGASLLSTISLDGLLQTQDVIVQTTGTDGEAGTILVSDGLIYDSGFSLTLLAHGDIIAMDSIQNSGSGDINLVAGWDGSTSSTAFDPTPFLDADVNSTTLYGNATEALYTIDGVEFLATGDVSLAWDATSAPRLVAIGSQAGDTRVFGSEVLLGRARSQTFTQIGYNIESGLGIDFDASGAIVVHATDSVILFGSDEIGAGAQIGHIGTNTSISSFAAAASASGEIEVVSGGFIELNGYGFGGSPPADTYAMIGHGSLDAASLLQTSGDRSGNIVVIADGELGLRSTITADVSSLAWIGHATVDGVISGADITVEALGFYLEQSDFALADGLDIVMLGETSEGGTIRYTQTGLQPLLLLGTTTDLSTAGDVVIQAAGDVELDSTFFFSNTGGGSVALVAGGNFQNNSGGAGFGDMGDGVWAVYSTEPFLDNNDIGVMDADIIGWTTGFDIANPFNPFSGSGLFGNGLYYEVTPLITISDVASTYGDAIVPVATVSVNGFSINPADIGFSVTSVGVDENAVSFSADGFVNAGFYEDALTATNASTVGAIHVGIETNPGNLEVGAATVVVILADETKPYDGIGGYTGTVTFTGFVGADDETILTAAPEFGFSGGDGTGVNAGVYTVSASGLAEASGNYVFDVTDTADLTITQLVLSVSIVGNPSKVYDGTDLATLTDSNFVVTGFIAGEGVTVTQDAGFYSSPNASTSNQVTAALAAGDFTADAGTLLSNYVLPVSAIGNGIITQAVLSASIVGNPSKVYDGNNSASLSTNNFVLTGFVSGEGATVTTTTGTYASANASATNTVTAVLAPGVLVADAGTLLGNYIVPTLATGNGIITQAALSVSIIGNPTKVYDGTTGATLTEGNFVLTGLIAGEGASVTETNGAYASPNASDVTTVTATMTTEDFSADVGTLLSNYVLPVSAVGNGSIDRAVLTVAIVGDPSKPFDGTTLATLTPENFEIIGFVEGEGATINQTTGFYSGSDIRTGIIVSASLEAENFDANAETLLSNYILPLSATGTGSIVAPTEIVPPVQETRGIEPFIATSIGTTDGPADGLELISTETTQRIIDEINAGVGFCKQLVREEYLVDCLSDRLQVVADGLSAVGEYSEVRAALDDAAQKLRALALSNSGDLPQAFHRTPGRSSSRALTAVSAAALASISAQAAAIIESTELVLLRSSENSERRRVAFERISAVVDSTKVLLRSS